MFSKGFRYIIKQIIPTWQAGAWRSSWARFEPIWWSSSKYEHGGEDNHDDDDDDDIDDGDDPDNEVDDDYDDDVHTKFCGNICTAIKKPRLERMKIVGLATSCLGFVCVFIYILDILDI